ncbi:MAG TPA: SCO6880 family protein [Acidimicrobiales bacterium]|nr:SCO6880 family protein [Acidimicrobiales bacterium]
MQKSDPSRYRFGPLERRGLIAGWRGGQIASVAAGLVVAVVVLHARPDVAGGVLALVAVAGGIGAACWPVAGRAPEEWAPTVARWGADSALHRRRWRSHAPEAGHRANRAGRPRSASDVDGPFGALALLTVDGGHGAPPGAAVVHDARERTYSAVLAVRGHSFSLLGAEEKDRRVGGWSAVLAGLAREGSAVHRLQWLALTLPDDGAAVRSYLSEHAVSPAEAAVRRSYGELLDTAGADTCRHEVLLVLQVREARNRGTASQRQRESCTSLLREAESMQRLIADADVSVDGLLRAHELVEVLRRTGEASAPPSVVASDRGRATSPWPTGVEVEWSRVRTDQVWHATYWIAEWPRIDVGPDFLAPLLLGPVRRCLTVVMEPISPSRATRQVEQARTADIADSELRRRGGFLSTARRAREAEIVVRREAELADGHASFRFSGYVTVSAASTELLEEACRVTEQAAGQAHLELRRLYGDQGRALTCTLPLCRGLS